MSVVQAGRFPVSRGRRLRRPEHRFYVEAYPWEITPVAIAPVLPGDSLQSFVMQSRCVTDPLRSSVMGWWLEHYVFYCPISILPQYANMTAAVESGDLNATFPTTASDAATYYAGRGVNWVSACRSAVVDAFFRNESEQGISINIRAGRPAARLGLDGVEHSLMLASSYPTGGALGATQKAQEDAYRSFEFLREQGLIQMEWEEYLLTYGVRDGQKERRTRPQLLRYSRQWQYPSNVVEPTTGIPVTAVSWAVTERGDKRRYFAEPGFVVAFSLARPKVYRLNQEAHGCSAMDRLRYWLPALLREDPLTSIREDTATSSPLYDTVMTADHVFDVRDLLIHGDQMVIGTGVQSNAIPLPTAAAEAQFATQAMAESLFANPGAGGLFFVRQDGVIRFNITSAAEDSTDATDRS